MAKFYTTDKHRELLNAADMLQGCINRICVTDDIAEYNHMFAAAVTDVTQLENAHRERILEATYGEKEIRDANQKKLSDVIFDKTLDETTREEMINKLSSPICELGEAKMPYPKTLEEHIKYFIHATDVDLLRKSSEEMICKLSDLYQTHKERLTKYTDGTEEQS